MTFEENSSRGAALEGEEKGRYALGLMMAMQPIRVDILFDHAERILAPTKGLRYPDFVEQHIRDLLSQLKHAFDGSELEVANNVIDFQGMRQVLEGARAA